MMMSSIKLVNYLLDALTLLLDSQIPSLWNTIIGMRESIECYLKIIFKIYVTKENIWVSMSSEYYQDI